MKNGTLYTGTSGWNYKHWIGTFYPSDTKASGQLSYYQKTFDTVELNNPFYHLPSKETFDKWRKETPSRFIFSVKASRYITHMKKLKDASESTAAFFRNVKGLKEKLGTVLFQLPPGWKINTERLKQFLQALPSGHRFVFEFRNNSWYDPQVYALLKEYNCAFCIYELAGHITPKEITADFVYIRLHGPGDKYQGNYSKADLKKWYTWCRRWLEQGMDVYLYFDNDQNGYAAFNAATLKAMHEIA